jgi:hypothetical protein
MDEICYYCCYLLWKKEEEAMTDSCKNYIILQHKYAF